MADLTNKIKNFFGSEHTSFGTFMTESTAHEAWYQTVVLFRKGMQKIHENDLTGLEDIRQANEALKNVVDTERYNKDTVKKQVAHLNETVQKLTKENMIGLLESIEYDVGSVYDRLKDAGMPALINESEFFESEMDSMPPSQGSDTSVTNTPPPITPQPPVHQQPTSQTAPPSTQVAEPQPNNSQLETAPTSVKESAFEAGFNEGRKRWKKGDSSKRMVEEILSKELAHKSYSEAMRWKDGFVAGHGMQEEVMRDTDPKMFEENTTQA